MQRSLESTPRLLPEACLNIEMQFDKIYMRLGNSWYIFPPKNDQIFAQNDSFSWKFHRGNSV